MNAAVKSLKLEKNRRIIVISDIHGNTQVLKDLLAKVSYTKGDYLIILGDISEKGPDSLGTIRYLMGLSKEGDVFIINGNCDMLAGYVYGDKNSEGYFPFSLSGENRLLKEICRELAIDLSPDTDEDYLRDTIYTFYREEIEWLNSFPDIIETDHFIFVHAGIQTENLQEQDWHYALHKRWFLDEGLSFQKYVVTGHFPVVIYAKGLLSNNPIIDHQKKTIAIDGGNVVKREGQLNALIIPHKNATDFSWEYCDALPKAQVESAQEASLASATIVWGKDQVQLLAAGEEFSLALHLDSGKQLRIPNTFLYEDSQGLKARDYTDYFLPVKSGDKVSVVEIFSDRYYAKKDGILGFIMGKPLLLR